MPIPFLMITVTLRGPPKLIHPSKHHNQVTHQSE